MSAPEPIFSSSALVHACWELTKPRLSFLSVLTALVGYLLGTRGPEWVPLLAVLVGTSFAAGGAAALNQWAERHADARMHRTRLRPLPTGRVQPRVAALFGLGLTFGGSAILALGTHPLAGGLALLTVALYLLVYTPLKRLTVWNSEVGAVPGALPPLIGWAAARGQLDPAAWVLFAILFCWQLPHFMSIAWLYRADYARGGFVMAGSHPDGGRHLVRQAVVFTAGLILASLAPLLIGAASWLYAPVAVGAGAWIARRALALARTSEAGRDAPARALFMASLVYLPLVMFAWVADHFLL